VVSAKSVLRICAARHESGAMTMAGTRSDRLRSSHWSTYYFTTGILIQRGQVFAFPNKRIDNTGTRNTVALVTFRDRLHK